MPTLHVRNIPEEVYERLRQRAQRENRSISAEVIVILSQAVAAPAPTQEEILDRIRRRRFFNPAEAGAPSSTTLLREDRDR